MNNERAVVVFSGGQDSTTCLFWAKQQFKEVYALTFQYGQRHAKEVEHAKKIAKEVDVPLYVLDVDIFKHLAPNALTDASIPIEQREGDVPSTFVPGRNHLFFSFAAVYAYQIGAKHIVTGVSETDFSGYPDCRNGFVQSLNVTINLAMDTDFVYHTPLMWKDKADVWALADELGVLDYIRTETLTCYEGIPAEGCGKCPACQLRANGLRQYRERKEQV